MKENIHPNYHTVKVVMTDGTEFETRTCAGKEGDVIKLDVDPLTHQAWTGGASRARETGRLAQFKSRYAGFGDIGGKQEQSK